jgi:hypothetical protein
VRLPSSSLAASWSYFSNLGVLRFYQICLAAGIADFVQQLLMLFGLLSLGVAAAFIIAQSDFREKKQLREEGVAIGMEKGKSVKCLEIAK